MSDDVIFEPLPATAHAGNGNEAEWPNALRARPGEWARLAHRSNGGGLRQYWGPQGFEIKQRTVDGEKRIYARFVGLNGEHK